MKQKFGIQPLKEPPPVVAQAFQTLKDTKNKKRDVFFSLFLRAH